MILSSPASNRYERMITATATGFLAQNHQGQPTILLLLTNSRHGGRAEGERTILRQEGRGGVGVDLQDQAQSAGAATPARRA